MRGKRSKQYRKLMHQYALTFGFHEPYQVLLDAQMVQDSARFKMDLVAGLEKTLHGSVKAMISQCSIRHLYAAGDQSVIALAKQFERRRCGHHELDEPLSALECIRSIVDPKNTITNRHRYIGAVQDPEVRSSLRRIPGVPLVYVNRSVMIMESMANATEDFRAKEERDKFRTGLTSRRNESVLGKRKRALENEVDTQKDAPSETQVKEDAEPKKGKKRTPKGPNPLSMRKPKKKPPAETNPIPEGLAKGPPAVHKPMGGESAGHTNFTKGAEAKRKRKRKPSNWKNAIVDKVLAQKAELSAGVD